MCLPNGNLTQPHVRLMQIINIMVGLFEILTPSFSPEHCTIVKENFEVTAHSSGNLTRY